MTKHKKESGENKFCTVRGKPCECGNNYTDVVKKGLMKDIKYPLKITYKKKPRPPRVIWLSFQAHHILCVACVNGKVYSNKYIKDIVGETDWCINKSNNMVAMPVLAHTIFWYVSTRPIFGEWLCPPFNNICQHDWDHNGDLSYKWEVDNALVQLAYEVEEAEHEGEPVDLAAALDAESSRFRGVLEGRASRQGGTHRAWLDGVSDPKGNWYEPFSMASTANINKKTFPISKFDNKVLAWLERFKKAVGG